MTNTADQNSAILLEQCSAVLKGFENNDVQTGRKYNIFKITYINEKEVIMCRVLADLLNPKGRHYRGDTYLKYFVEIINEKLKTPLGLDTKNARVSTEYSTDTKRRIDIVIEDGKIFIPIEVKIYAGDQENQVPDYAKFSSLKNVNRNIPVLYLTINGKNPNNANANEYINISFETDILKWLNKCLKNSDTEKTVPIREILKQLIEAIKSICGKSEDENMKNAINQLIIKSDDNIKAAIAIYEAIESLDDQTYDSFKNKVLVQLQKIIADASWKEDGWSQIIVPIKNNKYTLAINYNWWEIGIWIDENIKNNDTKEINSLFKKMDELTGVKGNEWEDGCIWGSDEVVHPGLSNVEEELYPYKLYKQYTENTADVVNTIVKMVNELNNA